MPIEFINTDLTKDELDFNQWQEYLIQAACSIYGIEPSILSDPIITEDIDHEEISQDYYLKYLPPSK
jgi:hypothetical protein